MGRLHTRYAPVRRSPAVYCYTPLPLDLHVLSLPLAFILSQDQTLRCLCCFFFFLEKLGNRVCPMPGRSYKVELKFTFVSSLLPCLAFFLACCPVALCHCAPLSRLGHRPRCDCECKVTASRSPCQDPATCFFSEMRGKARLRL